MVVGYYLFTANLRAKPCNRYGLKSYCAHELAAILYSSQSKCLWHHYFA